MASTGGLTPRAAAGRDGMRAEAGRPLPSYMRSTAGGSSNSSTGGAASARKSTVAHFGRMCNPRQGFAIPGEMRTPLERDVGAFEGASTPRGMNSGRFASARIPQPDTAPTQQRRAVPLGSLSNGSSAHDVPPPSHQWGDAPPPRAAQMGGGSSSNSRPDISASAEEPRGEGVASANASFVGGASEVATGKTAVLLICACDSHGVPVSHGGDPFIASVHGPAACRTEIRDLLDGRYELHVTTPTISGDFRVAVTLRGRSIGGSPHALTVLAPVAHAQHCEASGTALELATAGEAGTFEMVAHDAHGRRMTYGGEQYSLRLTRIGDLADTAENQRINEAKARGAKGGRGRNGRGGRGSSSGGGRRKRSGGASDGNGADGDFEGEEADEAKVIFGRVEDRRDGSYQGSYVVNDSGRYSLAVHDLKVGRQIKGSPWTILVAPGLTYAPASFLRGRDLGRAVAGETMHFELASRDARGNAQLFGGEPWHAELAGPYPNNEPIEVPLNDRGDGFYKGRCTMALAGEYTLSVTLRGGHARGSPLRISTAASGGHPARCTAEGTGLRAAFKGQPATFSLIARDAFSNRISRGAHGYNVRVRPPLSATRAPDVYVGELGDGQVGCEWVPTVRGRHVISVTLGGIPIDGSDFICNVAG